MLLKTKFHSLIMVCIALQSMPAHGYTDNHADDPADVAVPQAAAPKPPPAPPLVIDGKTLIKPKRVLEIPFHLSPYEAMRQAEFSEKNVRTEVAKVEADYPKALYMVTFYLPMTRTGPMKLPRDPNIYLSAILKEIKELKIPSKRARSSVEYTYRLSQPRIIIRCYNC